jgi:hypothetical protein
MRTIENMLMDQAPMTVQVYLMEAVKSIDSEFGDGYAKNNPELVGAFISACAVGFQSGVLWNKRGSLCA